MVFLLVYMLELPSERKSGPALGLENSFSEPRKRISTVRGKPRNTETSVETKNVRRVLDHRETTGICRAESRIYSPTTA